MIEFVLYLALLALGLAWASINEGRKTIRAERKWRYSWESRAVLAEKALGVVRGTRDALIEQRDELQAQLDFRWRVDGEMRLGVWYPLDEVGRGRRYKLPMQSLADWSKVDVLPLTDILATELKDERDPFAPHGIRRYIRRIR
jgi:hypothetical protein